MTTDHDVRAHALWAGVVIVVALLVVDGVTAATAAIGFVGGCGFVAGFMTPRKP